MATSAMLILLCAAASAAPASEPAQAPFAVRLALPGPAAGGPIQALPAARAAPLAVLAEVPAEPERPAETPPTGEQLAATSLPVPTVAAAPRVRFPGLIPLSYNLAGGARAGDAIEVDKPVSFAGADAGRIALRIDGNAKVYALGSRLAEIIARQSGEGAVPKGLEQDFVSLDRLRALGIGVRYDAIRDRLMVEPPGA